MIKSPDVEPTAASSLENFYSDALDSYIASGREAELQQAYEVGRGALATGCGVLDMASAHHAALVRRLDREPHLASIRLEMERAEVFFRESLSPYEMAHRGFRDGIAALRQINETLEREIQRIAHAVHDEAGQLLVGARLAMAELAADLGPNSQKGLETVGAILGQAEEHLRRFSHELRPTVLDDLGLVPALEFLAGGFGHRSGISVQVKSSLSGRCAANVEVALYRIVQEALNNVARHAKARNISIELDRSGRQLECRVQDDGIGFDTQAACSPGGTRGLGLIGIRERLAAIGGSLKVDSVKGKGTSVLLQIPMET